VGVIVFEIVFEELVEILEENDPVKDFVGDFELVTLAVKDLSGVGGGGDRDEVLLVEMEKVFDFDPEGLGVDVVVGVRVFERVAVGDRVKVGVSVVDRVDEGEFEPVGEKLLEGVGVRDEVRVKEIEDDCVIDLVGVLLEEILEVIDTEDVLEGVLV